nr:class I SAM-dependent methyltransferase [Pseudonocardia acidicola]
MPAELQEDTAGRLPGRRGEPPVTGPVARLRTAARRPGRVGPRIVALARRTAKRAAVATWRRVADADGRLAELQRGLADADGRFGELQRRLDEFAGRQVRAVVASAQIEANRINLELLKAEVRALQAELEELGMAFAPATGLAGAGTRFAEQREQVNAIERRVRQLDRTVLDLGRALASPGGPAAPARQPAAAPEPGRDHPAPVSASFNYVAFERRFRGAPEDVLRAQSERYADLLLAGLPPGMPVVDIGCGRGELLAELQQRGATVLGVDSAAAMVAEASERGVPVEQTDAVSFLHRTPPASVGAVFSAHLAEHLELDDLLEFVALSVSRLRPGGLFVAETPNPESLIVLGNSYVLDPTHVRPLHPALFSFLCESAGFRDVRLRFFSPAEAYHLPLLADEDALPGANTVNDALRRLNHVLFGPQEYAVVARTAAAGNDQPGGRR